MSPISAVGHALLLRLPPEWAHQAGLRLAGLVAPAPAPPAMLASTVFGLRLPSPVGLAAGLDKDARALAGLFRLGFGFLEAGTVTPRAQAGNPRPRLFRLAEDGALINRMGFNNGGLDAFAARLEAFRAGPGGSRIVGVNLGANKDSADRMADYVLGLTRLAPLADYLVINISSPNTPGLRQLQEEAALRRLLGRLAEARAKFSRRPPLLLKLAPDLTETELAALVGAGLEAGLDGLIATNTTLARPDHLRSPARAEQGGLSGLPLRDRAQACLRLLYGLVGGRLTLIGVGGIAGAEDAYARVRAGASLVQVYTALIYRGPSLVEELNLGLARLLVRDGFTTIHEAIGADHRRATGADPR
jgi:dihydroorotate dehydrogenase